MRISIRRRHWPSLFDLAREINQAGDSGIGFKEAKKVLLTLAREVLGLKLHDVIIVVPTAKLTSTTFAATVVIGDNRLQ